MILDETGETIAFAPLDPVSEGHVLVVPKEHFESLCAISEPRLTAVMEHAKTIAERLRTHGFDGVNLLYASGRAAHQSVPHFHIHLAPRRFDDELDLWPESGYEESKFDQTDENVRAALGNANPP